MRSINTLSLRYQVLRLFEAGSRESAPEIAMMGVLDLDGSVAETAMQVMRILQNKKTKSGNSLKCTPYMHLPVRLRVTRVCVRSI